MRRRKSSSSEKFMTLNDTLRRHLVVKNTINLQCKKVYVPFHDMGHDMHATQKPHHHIPYSHAYVRHYGCKPYTI